MRSVKGIYDGEKINLLEKVEQQKPCKVIVTFMEDEADIEHLRQYPADEDAFDSWKVEEEDLYQDYLKKQIKMKTLTVNIPDSVDAIDVKMQLAAQLFGKGILSSGQAADLAGVTKREFLENVGKYGISIFGESVEDLENLMNG